MQAVNPLPSNPLESFTYDPVGNRVDFNQNGVSSFNVANQLLEDTNFTYLYDNNGNLTLKTSKTGGPLTSYEYDAENKLVRAVVNGTTANYKYDGLGRRVEKEVISVSATVTRYIYDNEDILLELDGSNNIVARYTHGPGIDDPLIMEKGGASFFYHRDGLGSITEMTDSAGFLKQQYTYSSFGKIESQLDPNFVQPYAFTSREFDSESGLYFYRARYYDPATGRFIQQDPIGFGGGDLNLYRYATGNPTSFVDPDGLRPCSPLALSNCAVRCKGVGKLVESCFEYGVANYAYLMLCKCKEGSKCPDYPGDDPTQAPKGTQWRGRPGSTPGGKEGSYVNPNTGESYRPDLNHPDPIRPHLDYTDPSGQEYRIFPDGTSIPK